MSTVKVNWSGGKDSTCALSLHLEKKDKVKGVFYIPFLTKDIPLITKSHYEFVMKTADKFRALGAEMYQAKGITYTDLFFEPILRGKNKGKVKGYSLGFGYCKFRNLSKIKALENANVGFFNYQDIGIAFDEIKRQNQLNDKIRSILVEKKITEKMAFEYCKEHDILSPHYSTNKRDGCSICPNGSPYELKNYLKDYPQAETILKELDNTYNRMYEINLIKDYNGEKDFPYRNYENFTDWINKSENEGLQLSLF